MARVCRNLNSWGCRVRCAIPDGMVTDVTSVMFICQLGMHNNVQGHRNANVCKQTYDASCMVCHFSVRKALKGIGSFSTCVHARTKLIRPNNREYSTKSPPCNASEHTRCCRQNVNHESSSTHIIDQNMHLVFYWIAASFHWQTQSGHVGRRRQAGFTGSDQDCSHQAKIWRAFSSCS